MAYTEVLQDGMLKMIKSGKLEGASATAFSLSPDGLKEFNSNFDLYKDRIILRNQDVSNHPEVIRRLGVISMNGMIEADIYGNVNSTHIMGTKLMNGIGGSGDFARNAYFFFFMTPSSAKGGAILHRADGLAHRSHRTRRAIYRHRTRLGRFARLIAQDARTSDHRKCVHPNFKDVLKDYYKRAFATAAGKHTPHMLEEAFSWHLNFLKNGRM